MTIDLDATSIELLREFEADAKARNEPLHVYLQSLKAARPPRPPRTAPRLTLEEFRAVLDKLASGERAKGSLPPDFSRADIYFDHD
jgi:hypothetical protein